MKQAESAKLFEEFPEMQRFNNRLRLIKELKADAAQEEDPTLIKDGYETVMRLSERLYFEIITYLSEEHSKQFEALVKVCNERKEIADTLEYLLKKLYGFDDEKYLAAPIKEKRPRHLKLVKKRELPAPPR